MVVIVANGEFPKSLRCMDILRRAEHVVCCDGAAVSMMAEGLEPEIVVGDLDSLPPECRRRLEGRVVHVAEQETNDLSKSVRYCMAQGWLDVVILGAGGRREDHALGNIALLVDFSKALRRCRMVSDYGCFEVAAASRRFVSQRGQPVSIFCFDRTMPISSNGLQYPLNQLKLNALWNATLNVAEGDHFELTFPGPEPVLVYRGTMPTPTVEPDGFAW